jgi:hypothetical protein
MPEPTVSPETPPPLTVGENGKGQEQFGTSFEELVNKAFVEARPDKFKTGSATVKEPAKPAETVLDPGDLGSQKQDSNAPNKAAVAPEIKQPVKAAQWKEVNEERARLKAENEAFKAEQEKWKTWETERKEYDTIKKQNSELLDRMQQIAVEKDPRFENYFKTKTDTAIALARQAVGDSHSERVSKLLQLPDSDWRTEQLEAVMSELGPTRQSRLGAAIVEMDRIALERSTAIAKSRDNWEAMQKADRDERQSQKQKFESTFQDRLHKWSDPEKGLAVFQKKDGDEAHNAEVDKRIQYARNILNMNVTPDEFSKAALWAASAPGLLQDQIALKQENATLRAEIEALKAGGPELQTGAVEQSAVDDDKQYEGMSAGEIIAQKVLKAGGFAR